MTNLDQLLDAARAAVTESCAVARRVQLAAGEMTRLTKDDYSPVTVADFAVQALIALHLRERLGNLVLVGEETAADLRTPGSVHLRDAVVAAVNTVRPGLSRDE